MENTELEFMRHALQLLLNKAMNLRQGPCLRHREVCVTQLWYDSASIN